MTRPGGSGRGSRTLAAGLLAALALAAAPTGAGAATPEQIRECVALNLPRYATPDRAAVAQYADLEVACRAGIDGDEDADVQITPVPGGTGPGRTGSIAPASDRGAPPSPVDTAGGPSAVSATAAPGGRAPSAEPSPRENRPGAVAGRPLTLGGDRANAGSPLPDDPGGAPLALLAVVAAGGLVALGGAAAGLRRHLR